MKRRSTTITKNVQVTLENDKEITTEVEFEFSNDLYGSDADGNRGEWREEREDSFDLKEVDDEGNKLSEEEKKEYEKLLEHELEVIEFDGDDFDHD